MRVSGSVLNGLVIVWAQNGQEKCLMTCTSPSMLETTLQSVYQSKWTPNVANQAIHGVPKF